MEIKVLNLGYLECQKNELIKTEGDVLIKSPISAVLIKHPILGNVLLDTGNHENWKKLYPEHTKKTYPVAKFISIVDALKEENLSVEDIDCIIISHLHFDHCGGLSYFKNTKAIKNVYVCEDELKDAFFQVLTNDFEGSGAYIKSLFDIDGIQFHTINDTFELASDITLFIQRAHTVGLIGLVLQLNENYILCGDTVYTKEVYDTELAPGGAINKNTESFINNIHYLKKLQEKYNAKMIFGHDYEQIMEFNNKGWIQ